MNFLAHMYLSCGQESLLTGNFLGDFLRNPQVRSCPPDIQEGIFLHRKIDYFTDHHPMVRQGVHRLYPFHHKYASVVVDIYYDFLLARNWQAYAEESLRTFTLRVYGILRANAHHFPEWVRRRLFLMIDDDWLMQYTTYEGLDFVFSRLRQRVSQPQHLNMATDPLRSFLDQFDEEFKAFFPDVIRFVRTEYRCDD